MKSISNFLICILIISCNQGNPNDQKESPSSEQKDTTQVITPAPTENFQALDFEDLNKKITELTESISPQSIMKMYYPNEVESGEGNESITMNETTLKNGNIEVVLIHDNLLDDSVKGEKYVMKLKKQDAKWTVVSLKKNWKCREGRGHTAWGINSCI